MFSFYQKLHAKLDCTSVHLVHLKNQFNLKTNQQHQQRSQEFAMKVTSVEHAYKRDQRSFYERPAIKRLVLELDVSFKFYTQYLHLR